MGPVKRDLRLDLLRDIGQWMIFLNHIPDNFLNWFTSRNFGFSDVFLQCSVDTIVRRVGNSDRVIRNKMTSEKSAREFMAKYRIALVATAKLFCT